MPPKFTKKNLLAWIDAYHIFTADGTITADGKLITYENKNPKRSRWIDYKDRPAHIEDQEVPAVYLAELYLVWTASIWLITQQQLARLKQAINQKRPEVAKWKGGFNHGK